MGERPGRVRCACRLPVTHHVGFHIHISKYDPTTRLSVEKDNLGGGERDDAAGEACARVAGGLGGLALGANLGGVALAVVILELVNDARAADDGVGSVEGDL